MKSLLILLLLIVSCGKEESISKLDQKCTSCESEDPSPTLPEEPRCEDKFLNSIWEWPSTGVPGFYLNYNRYDWTRVTMENGYTRALIIQDDIYLDDQIRFCFKADGVGPDVCNTEPINYTLRVECDNLYLINNSTGQIDYTLTYDYEQN